MSNGRPRKKILTKQDHDLIIERIKPKGDEDYAVVVSKGKGYWNRAVHVFSRQPTTTEINKYEQTGSKLKFRGQKAEVEGSAILAAVDLYNKLVDRAYDVLIGLRTHEVLNVEQARALVPPMDKRAAIVEWIGNVHGATRMAEMEGEDDDDSEEDTPRLAASDE